MIHFINFMIYFPGFQVVLLFPIFKVSSYFCATFSQKTPTSLFISAIKCQKISFLGKARVARECTIYLIASGGGGGQTPSLIKISRLFG